MCLSQIARSIKSSPTLALNEKASILKQKGEPVIHLGGGEPKCKAPLDAILAASDLLKTAEIRYAPADGIPELKQAIIRYTEENYHRKVKPQNVIVSGGAKQAIMVALQAIIDPQDEVLFPVPFWTSYPDMVKLVGGIPVPVLAEDGSFHPTIKDIKRRVSLYTKAIIINSPNNPSGVVYSEEFISSIVKFCKKKNIYLIMDDIYQRLIYDGKKMINCYDYVGDFSENSKLILINGVSKQYAMTGFRIGWAIGNKKVIEAMCNIQGHQTSGSSILSQKAALGALNGDQSCINKMCVTFENNRDVLLNRLNSIKGIKTFKPDGTFYTFSDFRAYEKDSTKLSNFLIDKVGVLTVPGVEFGMEGYLRISFCGSLKDITEGVERIKWALELNFANENYVSDKTLVKDLV